MKIKTFQNTDAQQICSLWNLSHPKYPLTENLMAKKIFLDPNFSPKNLLIVQENDKIIAFAYLPHHQIQYDVNLTTNPNEGYITYFSVHPDSNFEEVGKLLLEECEKFHLEAERTKLSTAYAPLYHLQGFSEKEDQKYIDLFDSFSYAVQKSYRRRIALKDYLPPENFEQRKSDLEKEGFYIGELPYNHLAEFAHSENEFSNGSWAWEFRSRLTHTPDLSRARVAIFDGKIIGGCMFSDPNSDEGRFGPFGINPKFRGKGLGTVLFADCLTEMKKRGIPYAWAQWTPLSGTAHYLYEKAGFFMEDCFYTYTKEQK